MNRKDLELLAESYYRVKNKSENIHVLLSEGLFGKFFGSKSPTTKSVDNLTPSAQESSDRKGKYEELVKKHGDKIQDLFDEFIDQKVQIISITQELYKIVDEFVSDYSKVGGLTNSKKLANTLKTQVVDSFMNLPSTSLSGSNSMAVKFTKELIKYVNSVKPNAAQGKGLMARHKMNYDDLDQ